MSVRSILLAGEQEAPSFANLVKQYKKKIGYPRYERWLINFNSDRAFQGMFSSLWNNENVHCFMSPVTGEGGKNPTKSYDIHNVADSAQKLKNFAAAYDACNLSLVLAAHPRVPVPGHEWCHPVAEEPDLELEPSNSLGGAGVLEDKKEEQIRETNSEIGACGNGSQERSESMGITRETEGCCDETFLGKCSDASLETSETVPEPVKVESPQGGKKAVLDEKEIGDEGRESSEREMGQTQHEERKAKSVPSISVEDYSETQTEENEGKEPEVKSEGEVELGTERSGPLEESLPSFKERNDSRKDGAEGDEKQSKKLEMSSTEVVSFTCGEVPEDMTVSLAEAAVDVKLTKEMCKIVESEMKSSPKLPIDLPKKIPSAGNKEQATSADKSFEEEEDSSEQAAIDAAIDESMEKLYEGVMETRNEDATAKSEDSKSTGTMYGDLVSTYEMRALMLFKSRDFERCITDSDLALKYGCERLRGVELLREKSEELLSKGTKQRSKDKLPQLLSECQPAPILNESNANIPALSAAVKCKYTFPGGKFLVAGKDIRPGDILGIEEPYCSIVNRGELMNFCANCLQRCGTPIPCPDCCVVVFCSEACQMKDWKHPHWPLCNVVLPSLVAMKMDSIAMLAAHVLTKTTFLKVKAMMEDLVKEEKLPGQVQGFDVDGIFRSGYRSVYHQITNEKMRSEEQRFIVSAEAFAITKLLKESNRYFVDEIGKPFSPTYEDLMLTGTLLIRHLMSLKCSAIALSELRIVTSDAESSWKSRIGCGVYPSISLAKHSCNPNAALYNHGNKVVMFATRSIPKNTPVTLSYVTQFRLTGTDVRRSILADHYFFKCNCEACENDWFPDFYELFEMRCFKCSKAIDLKSGSCTACQIFYREGKNYKGSEKGPYNFFLVKDKLYQAASICKKTKLKILSPVRSNTEKNRTSIVTAIELMEKYVKQPCTMLLDAQEALRICYSREGSTFQVKERKKAWIMGPPFLINSSLTGREEVHWESYDQTPKESTPKRKARGSKSNQESNSEEMDPPPPFVPILRKNKTDSGNTSTSSEADVI